MGLYVLIEYLDGQTETYYTEHYQVNGDVLSIMRPGYKQGADHIPLSQVRKWSTTNDRPAR